MIFKQLVLRLSLKIKDEGIKRTVGAILIYPFRYRARKNFSNMLRKRSSVEKFTIIYEKKLWGEGNSLSGPGSNIENTINIRKQLPQLFDLLDIRYVLDAPCGDFNWIRYVVEETGVKYLGADIVKSLVDDLSLKYESETVRFTTLDLTNDRLPDSDLMINRDFMIHLSFSDTRKFLETYVESNIPYLLTTTHKNDGQFQNKNIITGQFRRIDLFSYPYYFPRDVIYRFDDNGIDQVYEREMCVWSIDQINKTLESSNL